MVAKENNNITLLEQELRKECDSRLSENMRPAFYEFVDKLSLTSAGKIDYQKLEVC